MPLFGKPQKSPQDLVKGLREGLQILTRETNDKRQEKASDEVSKNLISIKTVLYGTENQEPSAELVGQIAHEMTYETNMLITIVQNLSKIDFEGKKVVAQIFNNLLRKQIGTRAPTVEYLCLRKDIILVLMKGYENQEIALNCGNMLRECIRYEQLAKIMLYSDQFFDFFGYVELSTFDVASDAFSTFKDLLTKHKILASDFLEANYEKVFGPYQSLLNSENYVTRRQALKLLGELLLDRHNFTIMTTYISNPENLKMMMTMLREKSRNIQFEAFHVFKLLGELLLDRHNFTIMTTYISNPDNLKMMMNMLREKSRNIQFEAFHVFKVFVANPNKPKPIMDILLRNKDRLVEFLTKFHTDRSDDEQFNDEKAYLIKQIKELKSVEET